MHFLDDLELEDKELRLMQNLYHQQVAGIRINYTVSKIVPIKRGVRKNCVLSPDLDSLFSEILMRTIKNLPGIGVGIVNVNNLRYADDTVLIAKNQEDLQALVTQLDCVIKKFGMQINIKKTEVMVVSKKAEAPVCKIMVDGSTLNQVENFKHLGCTISGACKDEYEIKIRSAQAKAAFNELRSVLCKTIVLPMQIPGFEIICAPDIHILQRDMDNIRSDTRQNLCFRNVVFATNAMDILGSQEKQSRSSESHLQTDKLGQGSQTTTIALPWSCHTEKGARSAIIFRKNRWEESKRQTEDSLPTTVPWKTERYITCGRRSRKLETLHKWGNQRLSTDMITEEEEEEELLKNTLICINYVICITFKVSYTQVVGGKTPMEENPRIILHRR